jgi:hypothetical protein
MADPKVMDAAADDELLSMAEITATNDIEYAIVPAWGGKKVRIASVTANDIIQWSEANEGEAKRTMGLRLITRSLVDKDGKRISGDHDIPMLRTKSHKITEAIVKAILKLNGMNVKAEEASKND